MRALELVGFRREHWNYDCAPEYAKINDKLKEEALHGSILLAGPVGTGKTAMLAVLCRSLYSKFSENFNCFPDQFAKGAKYCTHGELTASWENEFNDRSDLPTEDYFKKAPILFLDDLFAGQVNASGRNISKLEDFIDWRWSNKLKTFIATNISLPDLWRPANKQYHRIARRLSEKDWMYYQELKHKFGGKH